MPTINRERVRKLLQAFDFRTLFIEEMGWSLIRNARLTPLQMNGVELTRTPIAEMSGVTVFEIAPTSGKAPIPDAKTRREVYKQIEGIAHENLLIFVDAQPLNKRTQSLWYWVKREGNKLTPREHLYLKDQPGDLFLSKLDNMVIELDELRDDGTIPITNVTAKLSASLDVEKVTKRFYTEFSNLRVEFIDFIEGIEREADRFWYASVLLNRLMFVYFLQKKGFIQDNTHYLDQKLETSKARGANLYYSEFLKALFFEGFAKPEDQRSAEAKALLGPIKYLNGGLFLPHKLEIDYPSIHIPDVAFSNVLGLFGDYSWHLDDTPGANDNEINPDVLGYIFEKYINQKAFGAYYTRTEITQYLCERTINAVIVDKVNAESERQYSDIADILLKLDADLCRKLLRILPTLSILDPACGSGAFLVAAMKTMLNIYAAVYGKIPFLNDINLKTELSKITSGHRSFNYHVRKNIITDNLYGVDIMEEATEIARLRLFLFLVSSAQSVDELEPLPNIDFNIMSGNSLIGLLAVDEKRFDDKRSDPDGRTQQVLFGGENAKKYQTILAEKNRLLTIYRDPEDKFPADAKQQTNMLATLRADIEAHKAEAYATLDTILLDDFHALKIKYEQAQANSKSVKRALALADIQVLDPFHWGYEFDEIIGTRGGFDVIITNPPWEVFEADSKEFFKRFDMLIQKKKIDIKTWEKQRAQMLQDTEVMRAWLEYESSYPHVSAYFKKSPQFSRQHAEVDGKSVARKINLYLLFTEQCYNLLRLNGRCGIVIPSGIYTDLGAKGLREMLFDSTQVTGLFGFENRKTIFEGVDSRFKFVVLTFEKGGSTAEFPVAFMRLEVAELEQFPTSGSLNMQVDLIYRLSPDSLSIPEFKSGVDMTIAEKAGRFPLLGEDIQEKWSAHFKQEFNMTSDSYLFYPEFSPDRLPLYEGKMIHQFTHRWSEGRLKYWLNERESRVALIGKQKDRGQKLGYQNYRLAYRRIGRNMDERTMIATILPQNTFASESFHVIDPNRLSYTEQLFLVSVLNSFVIDYILRQKVTANLSMYFTYSLPIPRFAAGEAFFDALVEYATRLICTTPEFDALAQEVGIGSHANGVTDPAERARLRAEIDGIVARLYRLTEAEFTHILSTFPLVSEEVKLAALEAFRATPPLLEDNAPEAVVLGESLEMLVRQLQDAHIQGEVRKALNILPLDADSGVFKVSKLFEEMTKRYFMALIGQGLLLGKGGTPLTMGKPPVLADMIDILVSNNRLTERPALEILRVERNAGAHKVRPKDEQDELGRTGEMYVRWYIYYLSMFEQRILDLSGTAPTSSNP